MLDDGHVAEIAPKLEKEYFIHPKPRANVSRQRIFHMNVRLGMYKRLLCEVSIIALGNTRQRVQREASNTKSCVI